MRAVPGEGGGGGGRVLQSARPHLGVENSRRKERGKVGALDKSVLGRPWKDTRVLWMRDVFKYCSSTAQVVGYRRDHSFHKQVWECDIVEAVAAKESVPRVEVRGSGSCVPATVMEYITVLEWCS